MSEEIYIIKPIWVNCPYCEDPVVLKEKERKEGKFICPGCNKSIYKKDLNGYLKLKYKIDEKRGTWKKIIKVIVFIMTIIFLFFILSICYLILKVLKSLLFDPYVKDIVMVFGKGLTKWLFGIIWGLILCFLFYFWFRFMKGVKKRIFKQ